MGKIRSFIASRIGETKSFYSSDINQYLWAFPIMAVLGALQFLAGASKKAERPTMPDTTQATKEATDLSRTLAQQTTDPLLEGQITNIEQGQAEGVSALKKTLKDPGQILSGVSELVSGSGRQKRGALMDFGARKMGYQQNFISQLATAAREQQQAFQFNEADKYYEDAATKSALMGSGIQNIGGAISEGQLAKQNRELAKYVYGDGGSQSYSSPNSGATDLSSLQNLITSDRNKLDQIYANS